MPPKIKPRFVYCKPNTTFFKPAGVGLRFLSFVSITIDELEAMRLVDLENLTQEEAAKKMNISQPTVNRLLMSARKKVTDALVNGKAIKIEGGNYKYIENQDQSR